MSDNEPENSNRRFACGIGPALPPGDIYFGWSEERRAAFHTEDVCPGCYPNGRPEIGTPLSQLSGRPGTKGYGTFRAIARSWGYN